MDATSTLFRFRERRDWDGKPKGYAHSYDVLEGDGIRWQCDVTHDLWPAVEFVRPSDDRAEFSLVPTRRVAALSYEVVGGAARRPLARVSRGLSVRWRLEDASGSEIARLENPASWPRSVLQQVVDTSGMRFVFVCEGQTFGTIHRVRRPDEPERGNAIQRWFRRNIPMVDWALELEGMKRVETHLPALIATTVLLLELDVKAQAA